MALSAPATRVTDFLARRASSSVPETSYIPGLTASDVGPILDAAGLKLADRLRVALGAFDRKLRGYRSEEAVLIFVAHDLNPRAMSPKVKGFVQAQSWFQDLTPVTVAP